MNLSSGNTSRKARTSISKNAPALKADSSPIKPHHNNAKRNARIAHNLHRVNALLLMLIIGACAAHIFHLIHDADTALTISATFLPALGATVAGILSQGEFERIAHRSKGMAGRLDQIKDRLDKPTLAAELLVEQANQAIVIMSPELSDWRIIFRAKPLEIHAGSHTVPSPSILRR